MSGVAVRAVNARQWLWALPWMLFLGFPVSDLRLRRRDALAVGLAEEKGWL